MNNEHTIFRIFSPISSKRSPQFTDSSNLPAKTFIFYEHNKVIATNFKLVVIHNFVIWRWQIEFQNCCTEFMLKIEIDVSWASFRIVVGPRIQLLCNSNPPCFAEIGWGVDHVLNVKSKNTSGSSDIWVNLQYLWYIWTFTKRSNPWTFAHLKPSDLKTVMKLML